jgi:hypothetical protein
VSIAVENLPAYEAITCESIRDAAAAFSAARAAREQARKDLTELEQTREQAEWADAEAAENARAEGKAEPKRTHVAEHDRKTDAARHEQKVADLAEKRALDALTAALDEHGQAWADEATAAVESLRAEWANAVDGLIAMHGRLTASLRVGRAVGVGGLPQVAMLPFARRQIDNCEFAAGQPAVPAYIGTGDVLAALAGAVEVEPQEQTEPVKHPRWWGTTHESKEIADRREFSERAASPDRVEERRRRNEAMRAGREAAVAEQTAG